MREETLIEGEWVTVTAPIRAGQNVRLAGEDLAKGAVAIPAGTWLGAPSWGWRHHSVKPVSLCAPR